MLRLKCSRLNSWIFPRSAVLTLNKIIAEMSAGKDLMLQADSILKNSIELSENETNHVIDLFISAANTGTLSNPVDEADCYKWSAEMIMRYEI